MKVEYGPERADACSETQGDQEGCYMYLGKEQQNCLLLEANGITLGWTERDGRDS